VKAYRTGWTGFVNHKALGVDYAASNMLAFLNAYNPADTTLDWGFKANPDKLHRITSEWLWEENAIGPVYDTLLRHTPWELTADYPWLVEAMGPGPDLVLGDATHPWGYFDDKWYDEGTWTPPGQPANSGMTMKWKLRSGVTFHGDADGVGGLDPLTPEDVRWSFLFRKQCGPGIAYEYWSMDAVDHIDTNAQDGSLGAMEFKVYLNVKSYWAKYWIGYTAPMNKKLWQAVGTAKGWDYNFATNTAGSGFTGLEVKAYHPWEEKVVDGTHWDLTLDGTGPWVFQNFVPGESITYTAFTGSGYYKTQDEIADYTNEAFHRAGNVNYPGSQWQAQYIARGDGINQKVQEEDNTYVSAAFGTDKDNYPAGVTIGSYNVDSDFDRNNIVYTFDLHQVGVNFKKVRND